jgi:hypothetical protein
MTIDMNKIAEACFHRAYLEEMTKAASEEGGAGDYAKYLPLLAGLAVAPTAISEGSRIGRNAAMETVPVMDWLSAKAMPKSGFGDYVNRSIGSRFAATHVGTLGGAATGALATYLLADYLKNKMS